MRAGGFSPRAYTREPTPAGSSRFFSELEKYYGAKRGIVDYTRV
jgi:hypothetical protein